MKHPRVFVVSGPSGTGKSSIINAALARMERLRLSVSLTTRPPRAGEVDGRDYHFVTREAFERLIAQDAFLEWAEVYGNLYGTSRQHVEAILAEGCHALLDLDTQGALSMQRAYAGAVYVFIRPPSLGELEARLRARKSETPESLQRRLAQAEHELSFIPRYDYVVENDLLEPSIERFMTIVQAEAARPVRFEKRDADAGDAPWQRAAHRATRYALEHMDRDALVQSLTHEVQGRLREELSGLIQERLERVLQEQLPEIVEETYRWYQRRS